LPIAAEDLTSFRPSIARTKLVYDPCFHAETSLDRQGGWKPVAGFFLDLSRQGQSELSPAIHCRGYWWTTIGHLYGILSSAELIL